MPSRSGECHCHKGYTCMLHDVGTPVPSRPPSRQNTTRDRARAASTTGSTSTGLRATARPERPPSRPPPTRISSVFGGPTGAVAGARTPTVPPSPRATHRHRAPTMSSNARNAAFGRAPSPVPRSVRDQGHFLRESSAARRGRAPGEIGDMPSAASAWPHYAYTETCVPSASFLQPITNAPGILTQRAPHDGYVDLRLRWGLSPGQWTFERVRDMTLQDLSITYSYSGRARLVHGGIDTLGEETALQPFEQRDLGLPLSAFVERMGPGEVLRLVVEEPQLGP
ncbi:hypothetical protein LTR53_003449 [Teratosphaeriaceae sp. CCFEE 6253]|nr:hypothetical protein LTR53_003449 [Teratosphaeriaceae sp. CCFEE 6253]